MRAVDGYSVSCIDAFAWLEKRSDNSIHAVVSDPPFGVVEYQPDQLRKLKSGSGGIWRLPQAYDGYSRRPAPRFTVLRPVELRAIRKFHGNLAKQLARVLVPGGHVLLASQNLLSHLVIAGFLSRGFELRGQIARLVQTLRGGDRPKGAHEEYPSVSVTPRSCWEPWLIFRKPCVGTVRENLDKWGTGGLRRPSEDSPFRDIVLAGPPRGIERRTSHHPSLKPQLLMRQLVWTSLPLGRGIVLDPFMGSGSTIAAAQALGVRSIGLEVNRGYFDSACKAIPKLAKLRIDKLDELLNQECDEIECVS
jgi:site-specific DNA-methyltransferase (adenine-specific)